MPGLAAKGITDTGSSRVTLAANRNAPIVTAGGLVFVATWPDRTLHAYDKENGKLLWEKEIEANPEGLPAVCEIDGRDAQRLLCHRWFARQRAWRGVLLEGRQSRGARLLCFCPAAKAVSPGELSYAGLDPGIRFDCFASLRRRGWPRRISILSSCRKAAPRSASPTKSRTQPSGLHLSLYLGKQDPQKLLALARSFLDTYPQSAFLAPVAEKAARASFDLGALKSGLDYAHFSLLLMPENPLLLVPVADVQANLRQNEAAMASARDALDYFDRFDRPAAISEREWPALKRKQQATAWFVIGRALVNESLEGSAAAHRQSLLAQAISALSKAHELNPDDMEFVYLLGLAYRYANDWPHAAVEFPRLRDTEKILPRRPTGTRKQCMLRQNPPPLSIPS